MGHNWPTGLQSYKMNRNPSTADQHLGMVPAETLHTLQAVTAVLHQNSTVSQECHL